MKETFGLINAKSAKPPNPKPSPKEFTWPSQRDADETVARKIGASLQELLPKKGWKHVDLARALWGTHGENEAPRNSQAPRRWVVADLPIPSERDAGYVAQVLDVSMARLLEPEGKFNPLPDMIRPRSDSVRFPSGNINKAKAKKKAKKKAGKTASGKDREKQRAYNAAYRARQKAEKGKRKYAKRAKVRKDAPTGNGSWLLADGVKPPEYQITSEQAPPGHVNFTLTAILPHERAMAILHMLKHESDEG